MTSGRTGNGILLALALALCPLSTALAAPEDTTADAVLGQPVFNTRLENQGGAVGASFTLNQCRGVLADPAGRLWVADSNNNRVLMYSNAQTFINGNIAELVLGQADFVAIQANRGGAKPDKNTLQDPRSVAMDSAGHLYVADSGNKRILRFDPPFISGMDAVQVFGQNGDFKTNDPAPAGGITANNLGNPDGVAVDSAGNLWLADLFLKRVVRYNTPAAVGGDTTADLVLGQIDFAHGDINEGGANPGQNTLFNPEGVAVDKDDNLYVVDQENNRVLLFKPPFSNNMNASGVFGQPGFVTGGPATTATGMSIPVAAAIDPKSGNLYVADSANNRVLEFANPLTAVAPVSATRIFGQGGDFTTNTVNKGGVSADSIADVGGVACDANGDLYAGDRNNSRVLRFNAPPPSASGGDNGGTDNGGTGGTNGTPTTMCGTCGNGAAAMMPLALLALIAERHRTRRGRRRR
jgi:sugar lactone lactonase YvrE